MDTQTTTPPTIPPRQISWSDTPLAISGYSFTIRQYDDGSVTLFGHGGARVRDYANAKNAERAAQRLVPQWIAADAEWSPIAVGTAVVTPEQRRGVVSAIIHKSGEPNVIVCHGDHSSRDFTRHHAADLTTVGA